MANQISKIEANEPLLRPAGWGRMRRVKVRKLFTDWAICYVKGKKKPNPKAKWCKSRHALPPTSAQPLSNFIAKHGVIGHGIPLLSAGASSPGLINLLLTLSLLVRDGEQSKKQRWPWFCKNTAQQQLKHWCVINTVLVTILKHSTTQAVWKKNDSQSNLEYKRKIFFLPETVSTDIVCMTAPWVAWKQTLKLEKAHDH